VGEYAQYYQSTIEKGSYGFKLALGGTGIGKTRGIRAVVSESKEANLPSKFVYCANRVQLLNEMYDDLLGKDGFTANEIIHLERNRDTVSSVITGERSTEFSQLLRDPQILHYAQVGRLDSVAIERACTQIKQIAGLIDDKRQGFKLLELMSSPLETLARDVLSFFKSILVLASDADRTQLLHHPVIQALFPYIAFTVNPDARVLLLTIHKAFLGFFDGQSTVNLNHFQDYIVFLDEFDFLEADLTQLICKSPQIEDPFLFVEMFYRGMKRHKLPLDVYPVEAQHHETVLSIRERLEEIVQSIDDLKEEEHVPFPEINQFTTHIKSRHSAIFQTNRTIIRQPLYLQQTPRSFEITLERSDDSISALRLFNRVSRATAKILYLFKEIEAVDPTMFEEMLDHCFPQSYLGDQVRRIGQLPGIYRDQFTRFDNLLESGFGLYEIEDLQQMTDKDEVKFRHYAIHTTPEKVLFALAQKNLVFGLSATADVPRFIKHFNEHWLRKQLMLTEAAHYFDVDDTDERIIQELNARKLAARQNELEVVLAPDLDTYPDGKEYEAYIKQVAQHFGDGFGADDPNGYRRQRVERFFAALFDIVKRRSPEHLAADTHLFFYTTFAQIRYIFQTPAIHRSDLFKVELMFDDDQFPAYRLYFAGNTFIVVFYDAAQASYIHSDEEIKRQYHQLFWEGIPVLLLTQYTSAGNGVNLQYRPSPDTVEETDFRNIHLMEAPYFFFDEINPAKQTSQEVSTAIKKNIWYQAKLFEAKVISTERFFGVLENLRHDRSNSEYRSGKNIELQADSLKNRIATYIQALGRIERVWAKIPTQTVFLAEEVFDDFARFVQDDVFVHLHQSRRGRLSGNLAQMMEQVEQMATERAKVARRHVDERLGAQDQKCREYIHELLQRLHAFRQGSGNAEAKQDWIALRRAALEHDFANPLLAQYKAVFKTPYLHDGFLYIDEERCLYPFNKRTEDAEPWRLNAIYDAIVRNPLLADSFRTQGFELAFDGVNGQFFVPYFYQAILIGALGEAAVRSALHHRLIETTDDLPDRVFELADLKVNQLPWYIDCKNYSERTMSQFHYTQDDPSYRPELNERSFINKAKAKFQQISEYHKEQADLCRLIFLNLVGNGDRVRLYFDEQFNEVNDFKDARIIVVQGCIQSTNPSIYTPAFEQFLRDLKGHFTDGA
jgi:hypothetical protein